MVDDRLRRLSVTRDVSVPLYPSLEPRGGLRIHREENSRNDRVELWFRLVCERGISAAVADGHVLVVARPVLAPASTDLLARSIGFCIFDASGHRHLRAAILDSTCGHGDRNSELSSF